MRLSIPTILVLAAVRTTPQLAWAASSALPQIDLGYEIHRALSYDALNDFYKFLNIRYAAPPTGQNRFRAPQPPAINRAVVQIGSQDRICPQATPAWLTVSNEFVPIYLNGGKWNYTEAEFDKLNRTVPSVDKDPRVTEDCLFLDVVVPRPILETAGKGPGAPVLVWIYGGGYTGGSKSQEDPAGLIKRSRINKSSGLIFVALNYRLGAFGWLSGPTFSKDGTVNAALYDQRAALMWVQSHIRKFGGDPNRVTVMGESAGGGSLTHQLSAYGGTRPVPFQQAILQSPAWQPVTSPKAMDATFNLFLKAANVNSLAKLRTLSEDALIAANHAQIWHSTYASAVYGPVVDGSFVPELPGLLFSQGRFSKNVRILISHDSNEGLSFADPFIQSTQQLAAFFQQLLPRASENTLKYITQTLYPAPPRSKNNLVYKTQVDRTALAVAEFGFVCNTYYINKGYGNNTHAYKFSIPPGTHGQDLGYTFYNGGTGANATVANVIQDYVASFVKFGVPSTWVPRIPAFPIYGRGTVLQDLSQKGIGPARDETANSRCQWWQQAKYR